MRPVKGRYARLRKIGNFLPSRRGLDIVFQKGTSPAGAPMGEARPGLGAKETKMARNSQPPRPEAPQSGLEGRFRSRKLGYELDNPSRREASLRSLRHEAGGWREPLLSRRRGTYSGLEMAP